jgi:hypothetical protein
MTVCGTTARGSHAVVIGMRGSRGSAGGALTAVPKRSRCCARRRYRPGERVDRRARDGLSACAATELSRPHNRVVRLARTPNALPSWRHTLANHSRYFIACPPAHVLAPRCETRGAARPPCSVSPRRAVTAARGVLPRLSAATGSADGRLPLRLTLTKTSLTAATMARSACDRHKTTAGLRRAAR